MKKVGWNCAGDGCNMTANNGPMIRTEPKGEPGRFMCLACAKRQLTRRRDVTDTLHQWVFTA